MLRAACSVCVLAFVTLPAIAQETWRCVTVVPASSYGAAVCWDPVGGRIVMLAQSGAYPGLTRLLALDREDWRPIDAPGGPSRMQGSTLTCDGVHGRFFVLGGGDPYPRQPQLWLWDGSHWTRLPDALYDLKDHAAVYDLRRDRLVVLGGHLEAVHLEWDGTTWNPIPIPAQLAGRRSPALAYDSRRGVVVAFGGTGAGDETWEYDGLQWRRIDVSPRPPWQFGDSMTFDERRGVCVMVGALRAGSGGEVWDWDGRHWTTGRLPQVAFQQYFVHVAYDPLRGCLLHSAEGSIHETRGTTWVETRPGLPEPYASPLVGNESDLFAIGNGPAPQAPLRAWRWDGGAFHPDTASPAPSARRSFASAPLPDHRGALVFGGLVEQVETDETWIFDGTRWSGGATGPTPRRAAAVCTDTLRGEIVLFGGVTGDRQTLGDTWVWSAGRWQSRQPAVAPPARVDPQFVFDERRGVAVLLGGTDGYGEGWVHDLWEWDGTNWRACPLPPAEVAGFVMRATWDPIRGRVVVGAFDRPENPTNWLLWEYDGTAWTERFVAPGDAAGTTRHGLQRLAFDRQRRRLLMLTTQSLGLLSEWYGLFELATPPVAAAAEFGDPCSTGNTRPRLFAHGVPSIGNESFAIDGCGARPRTLAVLLLGLPSAGIPFGSCTLHVREVFRAFPRPTDWTGAAAFPLPVPRDPSLVGWSLRAQAVNLSFRELALSSALQIELGN